jgi:phosphonate transport system ATP-binding protein
MDVCVRDVAKTYPDGTRVLEAVDFSIAPGEGVVLLGANGCGKSTLLRCMLGLEPLSRGSITIGGVEVGSARESDRRRLRAGIGSVFQQFNLVGNLSVFQNVLFGRLGRHGLMRSLTATAPREARDRAMASLDRVGLAHLARRRTDTLSGGQQQRVAIARMLMQEARIVLADEPVASLDPRAGREVMDLLFEIVRERGLTVVCVLHQLDLARAYAGRIIGLRAGRVVVDDRPEAIPDAALAALYDGGRPDEPEETDLAEPPVRRRAAAL